MSKIKTVLSSLLILMTLMAATVVGQTRPEMSRNFWANKRLPDSMKGIRPDDLAALAKMNEAARKALLGAQAPKQDLAVRRADGTIDLAASQRSQVVQTGATSKINTRPGAGLMSAVGLRPVGQRRPANGTSRPMPGQNPAAMAQQVSATNSQVSALLTRAQAAKQSGQLAVARDTYRHILKLEPYNREVLIQAGRVEHAMGEIDNAIQAYTVLLRIEPNHPVALNDLGLCQARKGDLQASLKSLQAAVVAQPRSSRYRYNLAKVLVETNQLEAAAGVISQLRGDALGKAGVGAILAERGRNQEAKTYLEKALVADPSLTAAKDKLASLSTENATQVVARPESTGGNSRAVQAGASEDQIKAPEMGVPVTR